MPTFSRAKAARESRRVAQFAKFKNTELNLVPLVDTFVSIVFFALTTQAVGELAPLVPGVQLPASRVPGLATQRMTLGIASSPAVITFAGDRVMTVQEAAAAQSNDPRQPLLIPRLYAVLKPAADSIRAANDIPQDSSVTVQLAIQGDRTMRYDLLSRVMQTARIAGFRNLTLQVRREEASGEPRQAT